MGWALEHTPEVVTRLLPMYPSAGAHGRTAVLDAVAADVGCDVVEHGCSAMRACRRILGSRHHGPVRPARELQAWSRRAVKDSITRAMAFCLFDADLVDASRIRRSGEVDPFDDQVMHEVEVVLDLSSVPT